MRFRFPLSLRNAEGLLLKHGLDIHHETIQFATTKSEKTKPNPAQHYNSVPPQQPAQGAGRLGLERLLHAALCGGL